MIFQVSGLPETIKNRYKNAIEKNIQKNGFKIDFGVDFCFPKPPKILQNRFANRSEAKPVSRRYANRSEIVAKQRDP